MNGDSYSGRDGGGRREYDRSERRDRDRRDRRRSRSPHDRFAGRSRRDRGDAAPTGDVDTYSSSRSHREREREERYSGRERRDDRERGWDRDRGDRRRERRDDERPPRRDRGFEDDRRGGGAAGGGGGRGRDRDDRGFGGGRDRPRSPTPPPKKREPTPDLTDVVSVLDRKRRLTQWDIKPPGYENVTAEQAKLSGMFPLPGAPRQQAMDPSKLQALMNQPGGTVNSAALKPGNSRQSKRLLISNLPAGVTEDSIISFLNLQLNGLNVIESTDPCALCQLSKDGSFALIEFRNSSDATVALAFDGITMEAEDASGSGQGNGLVIRRPKDYIVPAVPDEVTYEPGVVSSIVLDTPNKISIANIPPYLDQEQVMELLVTFGELKAFVLAKDRHTEESRGVAFCEYVDPSTTDAAVEGLGKVEIADKRLKVQRASSGISQVSGVEMGVAAMSMLAGTTSTDTDLSRVLQLLNMVTPEELMDNDDYEEICEDVREECAKYGQILDLKVPRPIGGSRQSAGVGKIFVKFETSDSATKALKALAGRKFADRTVVATYFPEENFEVAAW